ncbi:toxin-antitoxin system HicB family antitoxin, partial [Bifidobacterium sp. UTCIF-1]
MGTCAELPGLSWLDESPAKTLNGIQKVVGEAVADMEANGGKIPEPYADRNYSGRFVVRLTPEEHRRLAVEAAEAGVSLN